MAKIKKIKDNNGTTIYPLTSVDAVFDKNGKTLTGGGVLSFIAGPDDDLKNNPTINSIIAQNLTTSLSPGRGRDYVSVLCLDNKYIRTWSFYKESAASPGEKGDKYNARLSGSGILVFCMTEQSPNHIDEAYFYPFELLGTNQYFKQINGISFDTGSINEFVDPMGDWDAYWVLFKKV